MYGVGSLVVSILMLLVLGCQQENPVEKAGEEITEHTQDAIDQAKGVGDTLEDAAEKTAEQAKTAEE